MKKNSLNENQLSESDQVEIHNLVIKSNNVNLNNVSYSTTVNEVSEGLAFFTNDNTVKDSSLNLLNLQTTSLINKSTIAQNFCINAYNLASQKNLINPLKSDVDFDEIIDVSINELAFIGSNNVDIQKNFFNDSNIGFIRRSRAKNFATNAFNMSLGLTVNQPLSTKFFIEPPEPEPEPEPETPQPEPEPEIPQPEPEPEPEPIPEPEPEPEPEFPEPEPEPEPEEDIVLRFVGESLKTYIIWDHKPDGNTLNQELNESELQYLDENDVPRRLDGAFDGIGIYELSLIIERWIGNSKKYRIYFSE